MKDDFDWDKLKQKFASLSANSILADEAREAEILAHRAKQLAKTSEKNIIEQSIEVLVFELEQEKIAIDMHYISEALVLEGLTYVPGIPDFVLGVISRRGEIIAIIDLVKFLGLQKKHTRTKLLLINTDVISFGIAIDAIIEISKLPQSTIQELPAQLPIEQAQFLSGVTKSGITLLNIEYLISSNQLIINQ